MTTRSRPFVVLSSVAARRTRRDELLEVAARLFAERGFANVTMGDIGAASGVSGPALYHHFPSKEALLGEMLVSISEHLLAQAHAIVGAGASPEVSLDSLIAAHAEFSVSHPELITVHLRDLVHASEQDRRAVRRLQRRYLELWVDVMVGMAPDVEARAARMAVHAAFGVLNSTAFGGAPAGAQTTALLHKLAARVLDHRALRNASRSDS